MITHIVMWKFLEEAGGRTRAENMARVRVLLESLPPVIPQILSLELREDIGVDRDPFDMVLITRFANLADLQIYQNHPEHQAVSRFVTQVRSQRAVVDYENADPPI